MASTIAQAVFGSLFDAAGPALVIDREDRVLSLNLAAAEMLARPCEHVIGKPLRLLMHEPDRDLNTSGRHVDVAFTRSDGYPVFADVHVMWVMTDVGAVRACVVSDSTERRALLRDCRIHQAALATTRTELDATREQLACVRAELATRNHELATLAWRAAMGELVAEIAHHLNNPVGALASVLRRFALLVAALPEELRREHEPFVQRIHQISRRIESSVAAIVEANRSNLLEDAGLEQVPHALSSVLDTFLDRVRELQANSKEAA